MRLFKVFICAVLCLNLYGFRTADLEPVGLKEVVLDSTSCGICRNDLVLDYDFENATTTRIIDQSQNGGGGTVVRATPANGCRMAWG